VPEPPTILQIIPELDTGGAEQSVIEISEAIVKGGGRALVFSQGGRMIPNLTATGAEWTDFPAASKNPATILLNARRIIAAVHQRNVRLIQAESRAPAWSALIAARQCRVPFVTTYHGAYNERNAVKKLYNSVMARSDIVIANSQFTADLVKARYGTPASRLRVIYRGVDARRFEPSAVAPHRVAALREKWGVNEDQRIVLHAARLTSWKGQTFLIEAAGRMRQSGDKFVVILAGHAQGRTEYEEQLRRQISEAGMQDIIRLVGHVSDMPAAYAAAHVTFVGSVEPEAFGLAAAEAQAMGCPVISTSIGATPETVMAPPLAPNNERTGWLVSPRDTAGYGHVLREVLNLTPAEREAIGQRARRHVNARFTTAKMQKNTLDVYDQLLGTTLSKTFEREI
jgi:glycosyltransferase involved in cell wall biosynthesis